MAGEILIECGQRGEGIGGAAVQMSHGALIGSAASEWLGSDWRIAIPAWQSLTVPSNISAALLAY